MLLFTDVFRAFNDHMRRRRHWTSESPDIYTGEVITEVAPNTCMHPCVIFMRANLNRTLTANRLVGRLSLSTYCIIWRPVQDAIFRDFLHFIYIVQMPLHIIRSFY